MLEACSISDALITQIPADEEPLCGNAAVYAVIITFVIVEEFLGKYRHISIYWYLNVRSFLSFFPFWYLLCSALTPGLFCSLHLICHDYQVFLSGHVFTFVVWRIEEQVAGFAVELTLLLKASLHKFNPSTPRNITQQSSKVMTSQKHSF